jgi:uncharacterized protein (TIGR02147 family)
MEKVPTTETLAGALKDSLEFPRPQDMLIEEFAGRKDKNPSYSLRSFAQALGVSPSYLSLIFKGQRRVTAVMAQSMARKLSWPMQRRRFFCTLAEFETCRSASDRYQLAAELEKLSHLNRQVPSLSIDQFSMIAEWHHSAILAILTLPRFEPTKENIAERLYLTIAVCEAALNRLRRLGLVIEDERGAWKPTHRQLQVESTPSEAIRHYHREVLRKAMVAIENQDFEEREFSNFVLTVDPKVLPVAKKRLRVLQNELVQLLEGTNASRVYQLSIQLFRVDTDKKKKDES